jgi:acetyl esterase/lipase
MTLDPAAKRVLDMQSEIGGALFETLTPAEARAAFNASNPLWQPEAPEVSTSYDFTAPGPYGPIPLRLYRGAGVEVGNPLPALVYFHGGGWVVGDLDSHDVICRGLANAAGAIVISVGYSLAPEHKFPAGIEDAAATMRFISEQAETLGIDSTRIAVGGDSAGGNIATVVSLMARNGDVPAVSFQILFYPNTDAALTHTSYLTMGEGYGLTASTMRWYRDHYIRDVSDIDDWRVSPLRAPRLAGVAPTYIVTAAYDPLCDEGMDYVSRLQAEGVIVMHRHLNGQIHGFVSMGQYIPEATSTIVDAAAAWTTACLVSSPNL